MYSIEILDFCNAGNNQIVTCKAPDSLYRGPLFCENKKIEIIGASVFNDFDENFCLLLNGKKLSQKDIGKTFIEK